MLSGVLEVVLPEGVLEVKAGEGILVFAGETVQYRTSQGAEYIAVCIPAFSPETVHRQA